MLHIKHYTDDVENTKVTQIIRISQSCLDRLTKWLIKTHIGYSTRKIIYFVNQEV